MIPETNVTWSDTIIDDSYINTHLPLLPPVIDHFSLLNAKFTTPQTAEKFVSALRGRIISSIMIERCVIPKNALLTVIMLVGQMHTQKLSLRGMGIDDQTCQYLCHLGSGIITSLDISYNAHITSVGLASILDMRLKHLDVSGLRLDKLLMGPRTEVGWDDLFRCTQSLTARECFNGSSIAFGKTCDEFRNKVWRIEMIDFSCNSLQSYDAVKFLSSMARSKIQLLYFNNNQLDDRVLDVVPDLASVSYLFLDGNELLTDSGVLNMLSRYRRNTNMVHLSIAGCGLLPSTMLAVCDTNDCHRRRKTVMREKLMEFIGIDDIVEDALALL